MIDTISPAPAAPVRTRGLLPRAAGVIVAPRSTYAEIAARPRALGALLVSSVTGALALFLFLSTDVGRTAALDAQVSRMETLGRPVSEQQLAALERLAPVFKYVGPAAAIVGTAALAVVIAAVVLAVFNGTLGGDATFRQVFAIVAHSLFILALQTLFVMPLNYATGTMTSSSSVAVFLPMLDAAGFAGQALQQIDLFRVWWIVSLAIGIGVLYKRRTAPIAWALLSLYGVIACIIAAVIVAVSGA